MLLDLTELFTEKIENKPFDYNIDLSGTRINGVYPFVSPVSVKGEVKGLEGSALLNASVSFDFSIPCDRCARQTDRHYNFKFSHVLVPSLENKDNNDDLIEVESGKLDLDALMKEDILLELPSKFLCSENCKGLCPKCGKNLNDGPCSCKSSDDNSTGMNTLRDLIH